LILAIALPLCAQSHRLVPKTADDLRQLLSYTGARLPLLSAHRGGAAAGFPENCLETFDHTIGHTFAMLEVDPRFTKDGAIVLHHDPTLERTTNGTGMVADHTLAELKQLRLKDLDGNLTAFGIPTLDEALEWARGKAILVLDQKDVPVAARVKKIEEHKAEAYAMLIVGSFKDAQECHRLNADIMMEVMIPDRKKAEEFDTLGIPWTSVVAFVGHVPPVDKGLYEMIHARGAQCMIGTSRNLDKEFSTGRAETMKALEPGYLEFLNRGADLIESDIPVPLAGLLLQGMTPPERKTQFFQRRE
jgi:glycerophosphoryl diester phosphodiesterase